MLEMAWDYGGGGEVYFVRARDGEGDCTVDRGEAQMACLLKPVRVERVTEIALGGGVLPQKSTDFYPKLLSGETIFRIEGDVGDGE
jgi:uncharacterized protein (DUF1015 family)